MRGASPDWKRAPQDKDTLGFLRSRETYCVGAAARFLQDPDSCAPLWSLRDRAGVLRALLMHSKGTVFPVFQGRDIFLPPRFMARFLRKIDIHALQGLKEETALLESGLSRLGLSAFDRIDYDLMSLDRPPNPNSLHRGPSRLMVRSPEASDLEELFHLQALYEQEEVLPAGAEFFPAACRLSLESILTKERILVAELEGRILGKINTNAASFSRYQIGGVYVLPEYRGLGIGSRLTAEFARSLLASGKGVTLFVKKRNHSARNVYRRIGFIAFADYRITYY